MISDPKFLVHCRMTAIGGSECGKCECTHPKQCEMVVHPDYPQARVEAKDRIRSLLKDKSQDQS